MEYANAICFWFVLCCGMLMIASAVFMLLARVAAQFKASQKSNATFTVSTPPVEPARASGMLIQPSRPWPRAQRLSAEAGDLQARQQPAVQETDKTPHDYKTCEAGNLPGVVCGKCQKLIKTPPIRTHISDTSTHLVYRCPTCGDVAVELTKKP